jgi:hypothetical protein
MARRTRSPASRGSVVMVEKHMIYVIQCVYVIALRVVTILDSQQGGRGVSFVHQWVTGCSIICGMVAVVDNVWSVSLIALLQEVCSVALMDVIGNSTWVISSMGACIVETTIEPMGVLYMPGVYGLIYELSIGVAVSMSLVWLAMKGDKYIEDYVSGKEVIGVGLSEEASIYLGRRLYGEFKLIYGHEDKEELNELIEEAIESGLKDAKAMDEEVKKSQGKEAEATDAFWTDARMTFTLI